MLQDAIGCIPLHHQSWNIYGKKISAGQADEFLSPKSPKQLQKLFPLPARWPEYTR
jgi:hypothetical protein